MVEQAFSPHHEIVTAREQTPQRYFFVLHGVFGSGANWRLFMRRLTARCPRWGAVLVDVRGHGRSLGAPGPHTVEAVAADLTALERQLPAPVAAVVGHSLGGKLALAYAERRRDRLEQVWVLDSRPDALRPVDSGPAQRVLHLLESLPSHFDERRAFTDAVEAAGLDKAIAQWLAMNLRRDGERYRLTLELSVIRSLLNSYFETDLWPALERLTPRRQLHMAIGTRSYLWQPDILSRLDASAQADGRIHIHRLDAGHWLHVDAPEALFEIMASAFA